MRPRLDLTLYLVTDAALCRSAGVAETVAAAVSAGVTAVQLRDPQATDDDFVAIGRAVLAALQGTAVPLLVNDRVHLVEAIGAQGAHIGQHDLDPGSARERLGPDALLGLSVHTVEHVAAAHRYRPDVLDYLGVGPVWSQTTKPDAAAPSGLTALRDIVTASPWPCVAIGGINARRAPDVKRAGATGLAVVSAICGQPDVCAAVRGLLTAWSGPVTAGRTG